MASERDTSATPWSVMAGFHAFFREDVATAQEALALMRSLEADGYTGVHVAGPGPCNFTVAQLADHLSLHSPLA